MKWATELAVIVSGCLHNALPPAGAGLVDAGGLFTQRCACGFTLSLYAVRLLRRLGAFHAPCGLLLQEVY
jgi:hypothetical protein